MPNSLSLASKMTRSKERLNGCLMCRLRKKRCDNPQDLSRQCHNCTSLNIECPRGFGAGFPAAFRGEENRKQFRAQIRDWTRRRDTRDLPPFHLSELFGEASGHEDILTHPTNVSLQEQNSSVTRSNAALSSVSAIPTHLARATSLSPINDTGSSPSEMSSQSPRMIDMHEPTSTTVTVWQADVDHAFMRGDNHIQVPQINMTNEDQGQFFGSQYLDLDAPVTAASDEQLGASLAALQQEFWNSSVFSHEWGDQAHQ